MTRPTRARPRSLAAAGALCASAAFGLASLALALGSDADGSAVTTARPVSPTTATTATTAGTEAAGASTSTGEVTDTTATTTAEVTDTAAPEVPSTTAPPPSAPVATAPPPLPPVTTAPDGSEPAGARRVFVLGDSVILGAASVLPAHLPGWDVVVDAAESRFEHEVPGILAARQGDLGRVAVVLIGHNSGAGYGHEVWIRRTMDGLRGAERVVFLTAVEWGPGPAEFNETLRRVAPDYPSLVIADWNALSRSNPSYTFDGLHLLGPGQRAMAELVATHVGPAPT